MRLSGWVVIQLINMSLASQASVSNTTTSSTSGVEANAAKEGNPATPLRPVQGSTGFIFPAIWSFPPFFTLQPNPSTMAHQVELWSKLVLDWARVNRVFMVHCEAGGDDTPEVFHNKAIRRRLMPNGVRSVIGSLVKDGRAAPDPPKQADTYLIYWKKPDEWGNVIYDWVIDNGMNGTIMTFWEITEGELAESTEFHGLPASLLRRAIDTLVKKAKAQIIKGEGEAGEGVRFF
ncbi:ESCRT-II complex subunit-domain-containing protein [Papiliotrema laurentii]|uniref:ESCRT-II complex subunit VPS25 n=1 Tax=Papiliotrema laurentii TaxID=5418 RepID=A0AAD9FN52_PAPLA|nr:ESCRT-II complex subunit-domain-containing protein [Papiliotrema laurentii]